MAIRNSRILTRDGYKQIDDIDIEDALMSWDGTFENQQKTYVFCKTALVSLKTYSHPDPIVTIPEQRFYVRKKQRTWNIDTKSFKYTFDKPCWIDAKDITMCHYVGMVINTSHVNIPEFENYDWYMIGKNFSHYSTIQEWLQNAPLFYIKQFINGFDNNEPMTYHLALGIQRLYLKAGILSKIVRDSYNRCIVQKCKEGAFIKDGYAWYSLQKIHETCPNNIGIYTLTEGFVIQNLVCLSKN